MKGEMTFENIHLVVPRSGQQSRIQPSATSALSPGTNPGTGTAYVPTALPIVGPYGLPVPGYLRGRRRRRQRKASSSSSSLLSLQVLEGP